MAATNTGTLKYLELRQRLKEKVRKEKGILADDQSTISHDKNKKKLTDIAYDGSFFGPSETVLAERLIDQESKSSPKNQLLAIRVLSSNKKTRALLPEALKSINGVDYTRTQKVQWLKETRDYSFLFSDDDNVPVQVIPEKEPPFRNCEEEKVVQAAGSCKSTSDAKPKSNSRKQLMTSRNGLEDQKTPAKEPPLRNSEEKKFVQAAGFCKSASSAKRKLNSRKQLMSGRNGLQDLPAKKVAAPLKKKRQVRRECEYDEVDYEGEKALSIIRKMFNTKRFCDRDDSDMNMETSFHDQMKEERRSERLARKEDEVQLRLIKEEEKKKFAKKRKLGL